MKVTKVVATSKKRVGINLTDTRVHVSFNLLPEDAMRIGTELQDKGARGGKGNITYVFSKHLLNGAAAVRLVLTKAEAIDMGQQLHDEAMTAGQG
jgi:hypothetical protein